MNQSVDSKRTRRIADIFILQKVTKAIRNTLQEQVPFSARQSNSLGKTFLIFVS